MGFVWPFRTKDPSQYRRIDQGWDLQGAGPGEEDVLAVASGVVTYAHDPGTDGAHFGDPYPILHLNQPVNGIPIIYYGHTFPTLSENTQVGQGDRIATTGSPGGGGAPDHWLEIGPWVNGPTGNGQWMYDQLINAPLEDDVTPQDIAQIVQEVSDNVTHLEENLYNNQYAPRLQKLEDDMAAIRAKLGA